MNVDNVSLSSLNEQELKFPLDFSEIREGILYLAPTSLDNDEPTFMWDSWRMYSPREGDKKQFPTELLFKPKGKGVSTLHLQSLELFLGMFIGAGFVALAFLIHDLMTKKRTLQFGEEEPREYTSVSLQYLEASEKINIKFRGLISDLNIVNEIIKEKQPRYISNLLKIIDDTDTKFQDSSRFLKEELSKIVNQLIPFEKQNFKNLTQILRYLVNLMHLNVNNSKIFQDSAEEWWKKNKENARVTMEVSWFQPKIQEYLVKEFGENVTKEVDACRGKTDFQVYNIPVECKVINDKTVCKPSDSALEILENHEFQVFQEGIHVRCGFLIAYDFRKENIINHLRVDSIIERIKFKILGQKFVVILVIQGNLKNPSAFK